MSSVNAKRTAKHERDAWQFRYDLCAEVGRCEVCGKRVSRASPNVHYWRTHDPHRNQNEFASQNV